MPRLIEISEIVYGLLQVNGRAWLNVQVVFEIIFRSSRKNTKLLLKQL
jgi:hypothetical protein